jgi:hypothetical protein
LVFTEIILELPVESGDVVPEGIAYLGRYVFDCIFRPLVWRYPYLSPEFEMLHLCFS